jgi:hypothetical protein
VAPDVAPARVGERPAPGRAGVVDQQVEPSVVALHRLGDRGRRALVGQVDGHDRGAAQLVREPPQLALAAGNEDQGVAVARQAPGGRLPDPARRTGDDRDRHAAREDVISRTIG